MLTSVVYEWWQLDEAGWSRFAVAAGSDADCLAAARRHANVANPYGYGPARPPSGDGLCRLATEHPGRVVAGLVNGPPHAGWRVFIATPYRDHDGRRMGRFYHDLGGDLC